MLWELKIDNPLHELLLNQGKQLNKFHLPKRGEKKPQPRQAIYKVSSKNMWVQEGGGREYVNKILEMKIFCFLFSLTGGRMNDRKCHHNHCAEWDLCFEEKKRKEKKKKSLNENSTTM